MIEEIHTVHAIENIYISILIKLDLSDLLHSNPVFHTFDISSYYNFRDNFIYIRYSTYHATDEQIRK